MIESDTVTEYRTLSAYQILDAPNFDWEQEEAIALYTSTDKSTIDIGTFTENPMGQLLKASAWLENMLDCSLNYWLIAQLQEFEKTDETNRWPNAIWPTERAFKDAFTFIANLPLSAVPMPEISLADDGEINFLWQTDNVHVDLGFYGTGTLSYFAKKANERKIYGEHVPVAEGLPLDIATLLTTR